MDWSTLRASKSLFRLCDDDVYVDYTFKKYRKKLFGKSSSGTKMKYLTEREREKRFIDNLDSFVMINV